LYIRNRNPQYRDDRRPWERREQQEISAYCNWVGDICVVAGCNYAFCEKRALLPNGACGYQARENVRTSRSIEEEARREEIALRAARERLLKKTGMDFVE